MLFVCQKDVSLRLCVHYRDLNCFTIPNKYLLLLIHKLLDKTRGGTWFTMLYLKNSYNLMRIAAVDMWNTAFCTTQELFKYTIMPFRLTNTLVSLQEMMDTVFKDVEGCIWYLDNILIHSGNTEAVHQGIVKKVLQRCIVQGLAGNLLKSMFHSYKTIILKHVSNSQEVKMDPSRLETMPYGLSL